MLQSSRESAVPPLQAPGGEWALTSEGKALLLSQTFSEKSRLPEPVEDPLDSSPQESPYYMTGFLPIRARRAARLLRNMDADSSSGPDGIPAKVLKECAASLSLPVAILTRIILRNGRWPKAWRHHWIYPLYKKKCKSDPNNYRGIHLTSQVSKIVERLLGDRFQPFLEATAAYGPNQFAYSRGGGAKDALALNVQTWLSIMNDGFRVALYCSDVSGAF